ncbi:MAG TPA: hypothetical protein VN905_00270 [Candidatus Binatia bacterium]|nr:hypothetical protein [Candidatus Binatia bacterium]
MRTLTDVFAPGASPLPEGLRTLVVSPDRFVEPGMTVRATFAFYNLGGASATGLRIRFTLPDGLRYLVGSARIDDVPLDEPGGETALLSSNGADIGEVPSGTERKISISYSVAPAIENGAVLELQAAIASLEIPAIGSNIVRLVARSAPELRNASTTVMLEPVREPEPGEEVQIVARVFNSGQSSARDVIVVLPIPDRTTYVPGSARIDGREVAVDERGDPFGFTHAPIAAGTLGAGAALLIEYRARIDIPLENGTLLFVDGAVASAETPEFPLARAELVVQSASRFDGDETAIVVSGDAEVEPGERVRIALVARNTGTCDAEGVRVRVDLPEGLRYAAGSRTMDLRAVGEGAEPGVFTFDRVAAGQRIEAAIEAYAVAPARDGTRLPLSANLTWSTGNRTLERTLILRARPRFLEARNKIEIRGSSAARPGELVSFLISVANDGTTTATDAKLTISTDDPFQEIRYRIGDGEERELGSDSVDLGSLEPFEPRTIVVRARVVSPLADRTELRLGATLSTREVQHVSLGSVVLVARSRPRFTPSGSRLMLSSTEPLRPDRATDVRVRIENEGSDFSRDVRVTLRVSPEARLEAVEGASRDGSTLIFGDVAAGASAEATVRFRLARFVERGSTISVEGRLAGVGLLPLALFPVTIATEAAPEFRHGAALRTQPVETVESGAPLYFILMLRNTGDGAARKLTVFVPPIANTVYVPGSTSVNDVPLLDVDGGSLLWHDEGLSLEDVGPGVEALIRWSAIVNTPLPLGTLIEAKAQVEWDDTVRHEVDAIPLRVRSMPAFAVRANGLPFNVAGVAARESGVDVPPATPASRPMPAAILPPAAIAALPRAVPIRAEPVPSVSDAQFAEAAVEGAERAPAPQAAPSETAELPVTSIEEPAPAQAQVGALSVTLDLPEERLTRTLRYLEQADFQGLITHFFAMRAFFPDTIHGADEGVQVRLDALREAQRTTLDRLFIKLRLPRYALTAKDLEDGVSRGALRDLLGAISNSSVRAAVLPAPTNVRIWGTVDAVAVGSSLPSLEAAPLGSVAPWIAIVPLIGSMIERGTARSEAIGQYRSVLSIALNNVAPLPLTEFHRVLISSTNAALDEALREVVQTLRAPLEVTSPVGDRS